MELVPNIGSGKSFSKEEAAARFALAVVCRVSDLHGLSDYCGGFAAARIMGEDAFVMRGHNQHPGQVTVSNLFRCEMTESVPRAKNQQRDAGTVGMIQAVFNALPAVNVVMHGHTPASMVFSAIDAEIEPISQFGVMYHKKVSRIEFGAVDNPRWCSELVALLGSGPGLIFNNHGILTVGQDAKQAYHPFYALEQAMEIQVRALSTGAPIRIIPADSAKSLQNDYWGAAETEEYDGSREWEAWVELARSSGLQYDK